MVPQFFLQFEVVDDGPTELTAILSGNHAVSIRYQSYSASRMW